MHLSVKNFLIFSCMVLLCGLAVPVAAQDKNTYFQLEPHITSRDYQQGVMLLKLKPEHSHAFQQTASREKTVSRLKQELGIQEIMPVAPEQAIRQARQMRARPPVVDLSLMYVLRFNPQIPIEEAVNTMYASGMVEYVEPSYIQRTHYIPNDPLLNRQYYLELIGALEAWDISQSSEDIVIGIVDSGIDTDHPDLVDKKAINEDEIPDNGVDDDDDGFVDNVWGWDFIGDDIDAIQEDNDPDEDPEEGVSHGTYVAGCAVSDTDNGSGIAGVGFNTKFLVTKHSYPGDTANSIYAGYLGISYMITQGVDIINLSFGGPGRNQFVQDLISHAVLDQGCLVVASAGNEGENIENYPAGYDHVLSVTATDEDDVKASFSNTALSVDISAPGTGIFTTTVDGQYATVQGTSFSAPIVSGAAALVKAHYPDMTGMQIGEILRVTADESIYENPQNPQNRMGKGRLNIVRALTEQSPAVRIQSSNITNTAGDVPQEGDTVLITADFVNYLWASTSALTATLSTTNSYVQVLEDEVPLGIIAMNDTVSNVQTPFKILVSEETPENTTITLLVELNDGLYSDYDYLTILVNPSYLNIEENRVSTSISSNGRIGYQDNSLDTREEGLGFLFEDTNLLFEMGLMLGTAADQVSNAVRSSEGENPDNDFRPLEKVSKIQPGLYSYSEVTGSFDDERAGADQSEVTVDFRTMVWIEEPHDNYVMVQYTVRNDGEDTLKNFHAGLYADWDIGSGGATDKADWNEASNMGYVYSSEQEERLFAGIQELSGRPNYFAIDNDPAIGDTPFGVYDDFTDAEKFRSMASGIARQQAGVATAEGNDVSHTVGSGPYEIAPGDSVTVAFALHGALTLNELLASAQAAADQYRRIVNIPQPVADHAVVCYGEAAVLEASGGDAYRWYTTKTGGAPIATGAVFTTGAITKATSFFVSNVTDSAESVRTEVKVNLALNPALSVDGSDMICRGDSVMLTVQEAGTYLWNTGDTTQTIIVKEAGEYFVEVHNDTAGCVAVSDTIVIQTFESPVAVFQIEMTGDNIYESDTIQFTDQSTGDIAEWMWDFGDGTTSTDQNPLHIYEQKGAYEVQLMVTNTSGCTDSVIQSISVITSVEDSVLQKDMVLAPNPAVGETTLYLNKLPVTSSVRLIMLNAQGKVVRFYDTFFLSDTIQLNLEGLAPGAYVVQLIAPEGVFACRLLVNQ